jgi:hypothetical protein
MTQVPPVAVAPVPTSVSSYWSPLGVVVIAMGPPVYLEPIQRQARAVPVVAQTIEAMAILR